MPERTGTVSASTAAPEAAFVVVGTASAPRPAVNPNATCDPQQFGKLLAYDIKDAADAINRAGWASQVYLWAGSDTETCEYGSDGCDYSGYNTDPRSSSEAVLAGFACVDTTPAGTAYAGRGGYQDANFHCAAPTNGISGLGTGLYAHFIDFGDGSNAGNSDTSLPWNEATIQQYVTWTSIAFGSETRPLVEVLPQVLLSPQNATEWQNISGGYFVGTETDCPNVHKGSQVPDYAPSTAIRYLDQAHLSAYNNRVELDYSVDINTQPNDAVDRSTCGISG